MFNSFCIISCKVTNLFLFYTTNKIQLSAKNVFMTYSNGTQSPKRDAVHIYGHPFYATKKSVPEITLCKLSTCCCRP